MNDAIDYARYDHIRPIRWTGNALELLDQRKLPFVVEYLSCTTSDEVAAAIHDLAVRGAPAIGIAAAWGVVLASRDVLAATPAEALEKLEPALQRLNDARPTAVNLAWALARMRAALKTAGTDWRGVLELEALAIAEEDLAANRHMGALGAALIPEGSGVLTHCNTGSLATAGFGTALGVIRAGVAQGRIDRVYAGETRPWQQGARLTAWELLQDGIPATLIADSAASHLMKTGAVVNNGTDAPVEDVDPIPNYYAAVTRRTANGGVFHGDQKMNRMEALRSYTVNNAFAAFEDDVKGTLSVGKLADITVLTRDITAVPEDEIRQAKVVYTIVGGQIVYKGQDP